MSHISNNKFKISFIVASSCLVIMVVFLFIPAIPQDLNYHQFADQKNYLGIPNAWNVISNLPFILFGLPGLVFVITRFKGHYSQFPYIEITLFGGIILTGFGSGYYHIDPNNTTLVWDRLPMTISFMAFFSLIISKHIDARYGQRLFVPLILSGLCSTLYWAYTESLGRGDLRPYALIQFLPILIIPTVMILFPCKTYKIRYVVYTILFYIAAKVFEHFDKQVFDAFPLSGHSIKHVVASFAGLSLYLTVKSFTQNIEKA